MKLKRILVTAFLGVLIVLTCFVSAEKADSSEENDIELFEYAPEPNENVYIMCKSGEYFAVIRK